MIEMDAEIAAIFKASTSVSGKYIPSLPMITYFCAPIVSKGDSHNLMKISAKRRRSKKQIKEEKKQEEMQKLQVEEKLAQFDQMQQKMVVMQ